MRGVGNCHCNACRKAQGAAFRTRARVRRADFRWVSEKTLVRSLQTSPGFHSFVAFKAPWFEITGGLPQFEGYPVEGVG